MTEEQLIRHCAPTLAGLKTGSLFTCTYDSKDVLLRAIGQLNRRLGRKGLRILPLRFSQERALIYVYRPSLLSADLENDGAANLLQRHGYASSNCEQCLILLIQKLRTQPDFPHEIGLFLGYPPEDVRGFMENNAHFSKFTGLWKVYGDEELARKKFAQYEKCTKIYYEQWSKGTSIERLAVFS